MVRMITTTGGVATAVLGAAGTALAGVSGPAVLPGDSASMSLRAYHSTTVHAFLNSGGDVEVKRGQTVSLGTNIFTGAPMMATWNEIVGGPTTRVMATMWTADDSPLVPSGSRINGSLVGFIGWDFGNVNPVNFGSWIGEEGVTVLSATAFASNIAGGMYDEINITSTIADPWDGKGGNATLSVQSWGEASLIGLEFEYIVAPSPAAASVMLAVGAAGLGRRRRE